MAILNPVEYLTKQRSCAKPVIKLVTDFLDVNHTLSATSNTFYVEKTLVEHTSSLYDLSLAIPCVIHGLLWRSKGFFARSGDDICTKDD